MNTYIVLYCMPSAGMAEWMAKPEAERKSEEEKMQADWRAWMAEHKARMTGPTAGVGKTSRITSAGTSDAKNDIMLYSLVDGESQEEVAALFSNHPHLAIPGSWIDVSPVKSVPM